MMQYFKNLFRQFQEHPKLVGETYWSHLLFTVQTAATLQLVSICLIAHGFLPFAFQTFASTQILELSREIELRKRRAQDAQK